MRAPPDLTSWILKISRLSLCEFTPDCLSNQWSLGTGETKLVCRGREMFVRPNLVMQWVPGSGKVVRGDTKMSPGKVSLGVLQRGVLKPLERSKWPKKRPVAKEKEFNSHLLFTNLPLINLVTKARKLPRKQLQ